MTQCPFVQLKNRDTVWLIVKRSITERIKFAMENDFLKVTTWTVSLRKSKHKERVNQETEMSELEKEGVVPCIIFLFIVVIKHWPKPAWGEMFYLVYKSQIPLHYWGSWDRNSSRAGTWRQELK